MDAPIAGMIDPNRLGVMGHSFGALTTLALLGEADTPFRAGLAMAPGIRPNDVADVTDDLLRIETPIMFMMGQADVLALYENLSAAYSTIPDATTRYALVFPNGTHLTFSNGCATMCPAPGTLEQAIGHQLIETYATAFFQVHLKDQADFERYLEPTADLADGQALFVVGDLTGH